MKKGLVLSQYYLSQLLMFCLCLNSKMVVHVFTNFIQKYSKQNKKTKINMLSMQSIKSSQRSIWHPCSQLWSPQSVQSRMEPSITNTIIHISYLLRRIQCIHFISLVSTVGKRTSHNIILYFSILVDKSGQDLVLCQLLITQNIRQNKHYLFSIMFEAGVVMVQLIIPELLQSLKPYLYIYCTFIIIRYNKTIFLLIKKHISSKCNPMVSWNEQYLMTLFNVFLH